MLVGKTFRSFERPLDTINEVQVLESVLPQVDHLPCKMQSPFRADNNPSFSIFLGNDNRVYYKDFGSGERGGFLQLLSRLWNCTMHQVIDRINHLDISCPSNVQTDKTHTEPVKVSSSVSDMQVRVRPWKDYDYAYWQSYGVDRRCLEYAEVYPISHKVITKRDTGTGEVRKYTFPADKYAYCFVEHKEGKVQLKVYQPFNKSGFKWCSKMDGSVIGLWTKVPLQGERIVICSSLKDALCLTCQCHIPAICLQGEGYNISNTAASELRRRFKRVYICFDTDKAGRQDAEKLALETGFINIVPDLGNCKDLSDWYKSLENKDDFKQLKRLFDG